MYVRVYFQTPDKFPLMINVRFVLAYLSLRPCLHQVVTSVLGDLTKNDQVQVQV